MNIIALCERGLVPDSITRAGMRRLIAERLQEQTARDAPWERRAWRQRLQESPMAIETQAANVQHYEVPAAFFAMHLGPRLKYSCCLYPSGRETLGQAEEAMLDAYAERAGLRDGHRVLDLGCGWGSLSLWLAQRFPSSRIVGLSNSTGQRDFILERARAMGLYNLEVVTGNIVDFDFSPTTLDGGFDRVLSIEMFEHMRNYRLLLAKIAHWLAPEGRLFVHVFAHRVFSYPFEDRDDSDWMTRHFFRGGLMPSQDLLPSFDDDMRLERQWWLPGSHYARTAHHWLEGLDAHRRDIRRVLAPAYGRDTDRWVQRWRMFYMAVAELFGYAGGTQWGVAHYLFAPRRPA